MKPEELEALPAVLSKDFKTIEPHLLALDTHLTLRSYLAGYTLGELETTIWQTLRNNRAAVGSIRKGPFTNLTRWFVFIEQSHPEIQAEHKASVAKSLENSKAPNYNIALQETEKGVVTRFLPEPS
jgi:glutamyl-tRNA synthetase